MSNRKNDLPTLLRGFDVWVVTGVEEVKTLLLKRSVG
jgi:hypothetical protein